MDNKLFFFLVLTIITANGQHNRCDYTFHEDVQAWFKLNATAVDWPSARDTCRREGANLVSPKDNNIFETMKNIITNNNVATGVHTSFNSSAGQQDWDNFLVPLERIISHPDNNPDVKNDCIILKGNGDMIGISCDHRYPFICYKRTEGVEFNECGPVHNGYKKYAGSESCYKFHRDIQNWPEANSICMAEGGHLAVVNSISEAGVIKMIFSEPSPDSSYEGTRPHTVLVGARYIGGEWTVVDGKTLEEAGYAKFSPGEPNNQGGDEFCLGMYRDTGYFDDIPCTRRYLFLCEKSPSRPPC